MSEDIDRIVERCVAIAQEPEAGGGGDVEADAAFGALFALVQPQGPRPGFARRVVERARREPLPAGRHAFMPRWVRPIAAAVGIVGTMVAVNAVTIAFQPAVLAEPFAWAVSAAVGAGVGMLQLLSPVFGLWSVATSIARALAIALTTPEASLALSLAVIAGALAFTALHRMLLSKEESSVW
jgi:hypothetical protein